MNTQNGSISFPLPLENSNMNTQKVYSVLPFFGVINMTIASGTTIYRAYKNDDFQMIAFVIFVYFGTFFLDHWFHLYHMLPPSDQSSEKLKLKIGIWVLLSTIMFGFACEFSTFASFFESLTFFGVVISGNTLLFYVYFIWEGDKSGRSFSIKSGGKSRDDEFRALTEGVNNV
ncbi:hypothetical protein VNO77_21198 [Canavalia gladiata]|uniref:Uncharacterized protein n=1 Tax=Canavalia gladiata TaxID=3824 RepID=A0AAN9LVQ1_CANGL